MDQPRRTEVQLAISEYQEERDRWVDELGSDRHIEASALYVVAECVRLRRPRRCRLEKRAVTREQRRILRQRAYAAHGGSRTIRQLDVDEVQLRDQFRLLFRLRNENVVEVQVMRSRDGHENQCEANPERDDRQSARRQYEA